MDGRSDVGGHRLERRGGLTPPSFLSAVDAPAGRGGVTYSRIALSRSSIGPRSASEGTIRRQPTSARGLGGFATTGRSLRGRVPLCSHARGRPVLSRRRRDESPRPLASCSSLTLGSRRRAMPARRSGTRRQRGVRHTAVDESAKARSAANEMSPSSTPSTTCARAGPPDREHARSSRGPAAVPGVPRSLAGRSTPHHLLCRMREPPHETRSPHGVSRSARRSDLEDADHVAANAAPRTNDRPPRPRHARRRRWFLPVAASVGFLRLFATRIATARSRDDPHHIRGRHRSSITNVVPQSPSTQEDVDHPLADPSPRRDEGHRVRALRHQRERTSDDQDGSVPTPARARQAGVPARDERCDDRLSRGCADASRCGRGGRRVGA